jgi:hypothetical protein
MAGVESRRKLEGTGPSKAGTSSGQFVHGCRSSSMRRVDLEVWRSGSFCLITFIFSLKCTEWSANESEGNGR